MSCLFNDKLLIYVHLGIESGCCITLGRGVGLSIVLKIFPSARVQNLLLIGNTPDEGMQAG